MDASQILRIMPWILRFVGASLFYTRQNVSDFFDDGIAAVRLGGAHDPAAICQDRVCDRR
jgi:hypothetical protein